MKKIKNQDGIASIILVLIIFVILFLAVWISLDFLGIIEVPKEYSITRFLELTVETNYQGETTDVEKRVIKKKTQSNFDESNEIEEIEAGKIVSNSDDENFEEEDIYIYERYYYLQLDSNAKKLYDGIIENIEQLKTGTYTIDFGKEFNDLLNKENGEELLNSYFQSAVNAVLLDNPEIFFLDITKMYLLTKSTTYAFTGTTYEVSIGPVDNESYLLDGFTETDIIVAESRVESIKSGIIRKFKNDDKLDQIKSVHDYLVDNLEYDSTFSNNNIYNMYGALVNNLTVCEGYAKAFKSIMDDLKIPCIVVCGYAQNSNGETENHAWNYVRLDNEWYAIDTTWDDPIIIGGGVASENSKYKYYLRGSDFMSEDHEEDGEIVEGAKFSYPNLSKTDY